jgi:hypothetical protein
MTLSPPQHPDDHFDPGSMVSTSLSNTKAVWYRRPWFLVTVGAIVVIGVSIISDIPSKVTKSQDAVQQNAVIKQINSDLATCVFALKESDTFYRDALAHTLTASNLVTVKNYLLQDQTTCSFASGSVYDMVNNIQPVDTTAGKKVDAAYGSTVKWVTYDAVGAIVNIRNWFGGNRGVTTLANLSKYENLLAQDRAVVMADIKSASTTLGITLNPINIPSLPRLPGT